MSIEREINYTRPDKETSSRINPGMRRLIAIGLACEIGILGAHIARAEKHEDKTIKPSRPAITRTLKPEELKASLVEKEETPGSVSYEKLSPKTYEVFLNNQKLMDRLKQNRPVYEEAAEKTGVDWKIIAAIHYREAKMNPAHSTVSGETLGSKNLDTNKSYNSLLESAIETGNIFKENLGFAYGRKYSLDEETLKRGFIAYNRGGSYAVNNLAPEDSPYVMNFYNEKYDNMVWPDSKVEPENLRDQINLMYGARTIYEILDQAESEGRI